MKFNKEEYENIKIPEQLNSIVQDAIEEGLMTESTGMSDQKPVNIYTRRKKHILRYAGEAVAAMFLIFVVLLNVSPTFAKAAADTPFIGSVCQVFTFREYEYADEAKYVNVKVPQLNNTGNSELEKRVNREIAKMINQEVEASKKRAEEEYNAYILTGGDPKNFIPYDIVIDYEVKCLDEHYVSFVISENETRATGYYQMFYYNIDLDTGKDITLKEWFGSNYKKIIADEVQRQINTWDDEKKFYLWEDLDLEDLINEDTQFYINDKDQVVVFFNKYELGAGAMGTPEFIIDVSK